MKNKEHYRYKINTSLMESIVSSLLWTSLSYMDYPAPHPLLPTFYKKLLVHPSMIFQKSQPTL